MAYIGKAFGTKRTVFHGNAEGRLFFEKRELCMSTKQPSWKILPNLSSVELAYIAGFLDGDGSIFAQIVPRKGYVFKFQIHMCISFFQNRRRKHHLIRLQKWLQMGTLRDRNDEMSELNIIGEHSVTPLLLALRPFLQLKLKQANLLLKIIEQLSPVRNAQDCQKFWQLCQIVDQVAALNDSKTRKITAETVRLVLLENSTDVFDHVFEDFKKNPEEEDA